MTHWADAGGRSLKPPVAHHTMTSVKIALVFGMRMFKVSPLRAMIDIAQVADEVGLDYICLAEHVLMHGQPNLAAHTFGPPRHAPDELMPEPLTTLAAMAGATRRIGLMTGILIAPLRPAALLAKTAATLHALSAGRLVLGVSTSWQSEEYAALGVPFAQRGQRLDDTLGACRALWSGASASFASATVSFEDMYCEPRPAQVDDIPIWFGGKFTPRLVRRITRLGHGWIPFQGYGESLAEIAAKGQQLRGALRSAGRDPGTLDIAYWMPTFGRSIEAVLEDIPSMAEAGVTVGELLFAPYVETPAEAPRFLEQLARRLETYRSTSPSLASSS
jgi:probable F420-dependent oxidoreductase